MEANTNSEPYSEFEYSNCGRCGENFESYMANSRKANICRDCRKPKGPRPRGTRKTLLGQPLTVRNVQVTNLVCAGLLNKEIAWRLGLTPATTKVFVSQVLAKTGFTNRTELAIWATKQPWYIVIKP